MTNNKILSFFIIFTMLIQPLQAVYLGYIDESYNESSIHRRLFVDFSKEKSDFVFDKQVFAQQISKDISETDSISDILCKTVSASIDTSGISLVSINFININNHSQINGIDAITLDLQGKKKHYPFLSSINLNAFSHQHATESVRLSVKSKDEEITNILK